jgi:hypothetical protein
MSHARGATMTIHYPKSDKNMEGDYYDVTINVYLGDEMLHMDYGDYYHDKGTDKAQGFLDALTAIYGSKFPILRLRAADREDI